VNYYTFIVFMDALKDGSTRSVGARCTEGSFTGAKFSGQVPALDDFRMTCATRGYCEGERIVGVKSGVTGQRIRKQEQRKPYPALPLALDKFAAAFLVLNDSRTAKGG
jgi:hypothetical protein